MSLQAAVCAFLHGTCLSGKFAFQAHPLSPYSYGRSLQAMSIGSHRDPLELELETLMEDEFARGSARDSDPPRKRLRGANLS